MSAPPELKAEANLALDYLRPQFTGRASIKRDAPLIQLETSPVDGQDSAEAYELVVDPERGIRITGNSAVGVFYGLQSLRGLLPPSLAKSELSLPALRIVDAPRFGYRGLLLDVARNFQPKNSVLRVLDLMARYKLNALAFHLADDEGWRLAIPSFPELTLVGARRGHTLDSGDFLPPAFGSGPDVGRPFGSGFYSRTEYIEILQHADALKIEVIPELEMPGHARAAIKAMEARSRTLRKAGDAEGATRFLLSEPEDRSVYASVQNYHDNVMNPALRSTYAFIERVVDDVAAMHREAGVPLHNLVMGGDEVPVGVWEKSPAARAYMTEHGLSNADDLRFLFLGRVEEILRSHGLPLSGAEEIAVKKTGLEANRVIPNPDFADRGWRAYVWNNLPGQGAEDLAYRLANAGYQVVLSPVTNLYFDLAYNRNREERGLNWGGFLDVDKPFQFIPFDYYRSAREDRLGNPVNRSVFVGKERLSDSGRSNILGIQGNLFSETLNGDDRLDYMLVPKLFGLAERAWAPDPEWAREQDEAKAESLYEQAWSVFVNILGKRELPRLAREQPGMHYRIPTPGLRTVDGGVRANLQMPGFTLRYTTDGSEPTVSSSEVRGQILAHGRVRVAAFDGNGRRGHTTAIDVP